MDENLKKFKISLNMLEKANLRLNEIFKMDYDQVVQDATIKRFEFTIELAWKTLKKYLILQGIYTNSTRDIFKESFNIKIIDNLNDWNDLLTARNRTSHLYEKDTAKDIYIFIKEKKYLITELVNILNKKVK